MDRTVPSSGFTRNVMFLTAEAEAFKNTRRFMRFVFSFTIFLYLNQLLRLYICRTVLNFFS